jgi:hypothetical protein
MKRDLGPTRSRELDYICGSPRTLLDLDVRGNTCVELLAVTREVECACKDSLKTPLPEKASVCQSGIVFLCFSVFTNHAERSSNGLVAFLQKLHVVQRCMSVT